MPFVFDVLFIVSLFPIMLAIIGGYCRYKQFGLFDNHHPRQQQAHMSGFGARVLGAQKNAWEALIFYSVMCVLAYVSSLDMSKLSYPAGLFLLSRIAHPVFYVLDMAPYRSLVFLIGWLSSLYIGVQAISSL